MRSTLTTRRWFQLALLLTLSSLALPALADELSNITEAVHAYTGSATASSFEYATVDLNNDALVDAVVLLRGRSWCGSGGCTMLILRGTGHGFAPVSRASISNGPIMVSPELRHGWHTLLVSVRGGGIRPELVLMRFNGTRFPSNPSLQPRATQAQADSATALVFRKGPTP
jgi:hypothetical protein